MPEKKQNKRNVTQAEIQEDGSIKLTSFNTPLVKNAGNPQKNVIKSTKITGKTQNTADTRTNTQPHTTARVDYSQNDKVEFFDATIDDDSTPARDIEREIEQAKKRALQEHQILENYRNRPPKKDKTYSSCVIGSIVTVAILLALTLVFFLWLKWYGVGLGFAVLTIIASQIWIMFLKKINKKYDALEKATDADEIALQQHLKEKYPAIYEAQQESDKKLKKNKIDNSKPNSSEQTNEENLKQAPDSENETEQKESNQEKADNIK